MSKAGKVTERRGRIPTWALEMPIAALEEFGLPTRLVNALEEKAGVMYIYHLRLWNEEDLLDIDNFGEKGCRKLISAITALIQEGSPDEG